MRNLHRDMNIGYASTVNKTEVFAYIHSRGVLQS